jgi:hypothetical protein
MSKLSYLITNIGAPNSLGIGSIGTIGPGEQRTFVVEEDDYNDQAIAILVGLGQITATVSLYKPTGSQDYMTNAELATTRLLSKVQTIAYAAIITPDASLGCTLNIGALTGGLTINSPLNPQWVGQPLTFNMKQDGVGTRVIGWDAIFKKAADVAGGANTVASKTFIWNGTNWVQQGGALAYY